MSAQTDASFKTKTSAHLKIAGALSNYLVALGVVGAAPISSLLITSKQHVFYRPGSNAVPSRLSGCGQGQVVFTATQRTHAP